MRMIYNINIYELKKIIRKKSWLILIAFSVLCAWLMVPNQDLPITSIVIEPGRFSQLSDASWIPVAAAICSALLTPLLTVCYCKNSLEQDLRLGTFPSIRVSPAGNFSLVFSRFLCSIEIMLILLLIIMAGSYIMILITFSVSSISPYAFVSPFLAIIPGIVFASSIAILLDSVSVRYVKTGNSFGLILFFVGYIVILTIGVLSAGHTHILFDFTGLQWLISSIQDTVFAITGREADITILAGGDVFRGSSGLPPLEFHGLTKSFPFILQKVFLLAASVILVWVSSCILPDYLPADLKHSQTKTRRRKRKEIRQNKMHRTDSRQIRPSGKRQPSTVFLTFRIYCSQFPFIWWTILALLLFLSAVMPLASAQNYMIPLIYGVSFAFFAQLGCTGHKHNMVDQIRCVSGAYCRQLFWGFLSHVLLSVIFVLPIVIRSLVAEETCSIFAALSLAVFIPSLSMLLGEVSQNSRLSEIVILILCFLMLNQPSLIIGISSEFVNIPRIIILFSLSAIMIAVSMLIRAAKSKNVF